MQLLDLTLDTPAENLALDEALLEEAEASGTMVGTLRLWEPRQHMVVVGRSSRVELEVNREACEAQGIPILRRSSGGAAIVTGPGCLMYSVVLSYAEHPALRSIDKAHRFVLDRNAQAINEVVSGAEYCGLSDLAIDGRKFSGNSLRCKQSHLLYHGTLLYDFPLDLIGECLKSPPRQPEYRAERSHADFVMNLPADAASLRRSLIKAWRAETVLKDWPRELTEKLARERYAQDDWNLRL